MATRNKNNSDNERFIWAINETKISQLKTFHESNNKLKLLCLIDANLFSKIKRWFLMRLEVNNMLSFQIEF